MARKGGAEGHPEEGWDSSLPHVVSPLPRPGGPLREGTRHRPHSALFSQTCGSSGRPRLSETPPWASRPSSRARRLSATRWGERTARSVAGRQQRPCGPGCSHGRLHRLSPTSLPGIIKNGLPFALPPPNPFWSREDRAPRKPARFPSPGPTPWPLRESQFLGAAGCRLPGPGQRSAPSQSPGLRPPQSPRTAGTRARCLQTLAQASTQVPPQPAWPSLPSGGRTEPRPKVRGGTFHISHRRPIPRPYVPPSLHRAPGQDGHPALPPSLCTSPPPLRLQPTCWWWPRGWHSAELRRGPGAC